MTIPQLTHIPRTTCLAMLALSLIGCQIGYGVSLRTKNVDRVDPVLIERLGEAAKASGLSTVVLGRRNEASPDGTLTSSYRQVLSDKPHDDIRMDIIYTDGQSRSQSVFVFVRTDFRKDPAVKSRIDALADACHPLISAAFGAENVEVERGPAGPPAF